MSIDQFGTDVPRATRECAPAAYSGDVPAGCAMRRGVRRVMSGLRQREPRLELPALRRAVAELGECTVRIPGVCIDRDFQAAHLNEDATGKGKGLKSHDVFTACVCRACHDYIDRTRDPDRFDIMRLAFMRTMYLLFRERKVRVTT